MSTSTSVVGRVYDAAKVKVQLFCEEFARRREASKSTDMRGRVNYAQMLHRAFEDLDRAAQRWSSEAIKASVRAEHKVRRKGPAAVRRAARRAHAKLVQAEIVLEGMPPPSISTICKMVRRNVCRIATSFAPKAMQAETIHRAETPSGTSTPGYRPAVPEDEFSEAVMNRLIALDTRVRTRELSPLLRTATTGGRVAAFVAEYGSYATGLLNVGAASSALAMTTTGAVSLGVGAMSIGPQAVVGLPVAVAGGLVSAGFGVLSGSLAVGSRVAQFGVRAAQGAVENPEERRVRRAAERQNAGSRLLRLLQG